VTVYTPENSGSFSHNVPQYFSFSSTQQNFDLSDQNISLIGGPFTRGSNSHSELKARRDDSVEDPQFLHI